VCYCCQRLYFCTSNFLGIGFIYWTIP
jgi:hypothetical protein